MKKLMVLGIMMMVLMVVGVSALEYFDYYENYTLNESMVLVHDDFSRPTWEINMSGIWTEASNGVPMDTNTFYIGSFGVSEGRVLMLVMDINDALPTTLSHTGLNLTSIHTIEFDLMALVDDYFKLRIGNLDGGYSVNSSFMTMNFSDKTIYGSDNQSSFDLDNQWHHYKIIVDIPNNQTLVQIDGNATWLEADETEYWNDNTLADGIQFGFDSGSEGGIYIVDNYLVYDGSESPYYVRQPSNSSDYAHHLPINCSNVATGTPIVINGSGGFSLEGEANQIVWTNCRPDLYLHWNNFEDYFIGTMSEEFYWDCEANCQVPNLNSTLVWSDYMAVYHLKDGKDSTANEYDIISLTGSADFESGGAFGDNLNISANDGRVSSVMHDSDSCENITYENWIKPVATFNSGGDNWVSAHWYDGGCGQLGLQFNTDNSSAHWVMMCRDLGSFSTDGDYQYHASNYNGTHFGVYIDGVAQTYVELPRYDEFWGQTGGSTYYIGHGGDNGMTGLYDEIRVSCNSKSDSYFNEVYQNKIGTEGFGTLGEEPPCEPLWICVGYGDCLENDTQVCNQVEDFNVCGGEYTGNYSEFELNECDYCTPDWNCTSFTECEEGIKLCLNVTDLNTCDEAFEGLLSEYDEECEVPPITGYVPSYDNSDLPKLGGDLVGTAIVEIIGVVGLIVVAVVIGVGVKQTRKIIKSK